MDVHQYFYPNSSDNRPHCWESNEGLKKSIDESFVISLPQKDAEKLHSHGYTIHKNMDIKGTLNEIDKEDNIRMAAGILTVLLLTIGFIYLYKKCKNSNAINPFSSNNRIYNPKTKANCPKQNYKPKVSKETNILTDYYSKKNSRDSNGNNNLSDLSDIQASLTLSQKEASICLISYFAGFVDDVSSNYKVHVIFNMASNFYNINTTPSKLSLMMNRYSNPEILIDTIISINEKIPKEYLLLTCYDLTKISGKNEAMSLLKNIANDLGYNEYSFNKLINSYTSVKL